MMTDKEVQLKAKLLKMRLAVKSDGVTTAKGKVNKLKKKYVDPNPQAETPEEIRQSAESAGREPTYIAQEHNHKISFRGHKIGGFKSASLDEQSGKYAKYWLLNAKETNGNGWGIAAHTAKDNMKKFIGRPLVVTAQSWHGASEYGEEYEHPYLPTNDINAILNHQEKFRVGSIVDVFEDKQGDWFASVEMLPKFASSRLPPFCSPAIYQLDAAEAEGQISKWEALHLAALTENPAYGARIALLKGTCVGTDNECKVQFKAAKQEPGIECPIKAKQKKVKSKLSKLKKKQKISKVKARLAAIPQGKTTREDLRNLERELMSTRGGYEEWKNEHGKKIEDLSGGEENPINPKMRGLNYYVEENLDGSLENPDQAIPLSYVVGSEGDQSEADLNQGTVPPRFGLPISSFGRKELLRQKIKDKPLPMVQPDKGIGGLNTSLKPTNLNPLREPMRTKRQRREVVKRHITQENALKYSKVKARLASLGEQNMTYQDSKKVKIHKKKHPEVRKAKSSVEDILRGKGRSVDGSHAQSTFLSSEGDFIGGGDKTEAHRSQVGLTDDNQLTDFQKETGLIRVQNFPINRAGDKKTSLGINSKVNKNQLKSIKDLETGGQTIGFSVGDLGKETTGEGYRDLTKALRERKFLG